MSKAVRFSSAAAGMVLLAGLAWYQGHPDPSRGQEGMLTGTALSKSAAAQAEADAKLEADATAAAAAQIDCDDQSTQGDHASEDCINKNPSADSG